LTDSAYDDLLRQGALVMSPNYYFNGYYRWISPVITSLDPIWVGHFDHNNYLAKYWTNDILYIVRDSLVTCE